MMPCFMGNMIWALSRLGLGSRPEVRSALNWLVMYQRFDDGDWRPPTEFPYRGTRERCWGRHLLLGCDKSSQSDDSGPQWVLVA